MAITTTAVTAITLTYATGTDWSVFNASNLASAGNLQANWNDTLSALSAQYKVLLNSAAAEVNILEGASGAQYVGVSSLTGMITGSTVYSALTAANSTASTLNARVAAATAAISAVSALLTGFARATTAPSATTTSIGFNGLFYATKVYNAVYK